MENQYYDLKKYIGQQIIDERNYVIADDRVPNPRFYDIGDIQPDKEYMASIMFEDVSPITSIYIEEIIYELDN